MAVKTLDQIISELGSVYNPQIESVQKQQSLIPEQAQNDETQLQAKQTQAFDDILGGARRRGMGFSGIPLSEQAKYTSTEFLPAIAKVKMQAKQQALTLQDALNQIYERRNTAGNQLYQMGVQNDFQERQFAFEQQKYQDALRAQAEERRRASAEASRSAYINSLYGQGGGATAPQAPQPSQQETQVAKQINTLRQLDGLGLATAIKGLRTRAQQGDGVAKLIAQKYYQSINKNIPFAEFR